MVNKIGYYCFNYRGNYLLFEFNFCGVCIDVFGYILVCNYFYYDFFVYFFDENGYFFMFFLIKYWLDEDFF